jgi:hypothetical protein
MLDPKALEARYKASINLMEGTIRKATGREKFSLTPEKRTGLATLLENFSMAVRKAQGRKGSVKSDLLESVGTGLSDVGPYKTFGINLITAVMSNVVADKIVSVQPMTARTGEVRYLKYKYANTKGATKAGTLLSSALEFAGGDFNYSSETVTEESLTSVNGTSGAGVLTWKAVKPGTVKVVDTASGLEIAADNGKGELAGTGVTGTVNYETGAVNLTFVAAQSNKELSTNYEYITTGTDPQVAEVTTEVDVMPMIAKSRKLRTAFSFDAAFDLKGDYGYDIDAETIAYFSAEIAHEIDGEIMDDLKAMAKSNTTKIADWDSTAPTGVSRADHDDAFWNNIIKGGNLIFQRIKRGRASFVIAGVTVCNTIEAMRKFVPSGFDATGPHICGTVNNVPVIKNPFFADDEYVVGYKGTSLFDSGYIYAPYMPVTVIDMIKPDGFTFGKGFVTAYGKKSLNAACYSYGKVV